MKLKSYISNGAGANQVREVQIRLAADASPGAGYTLLGNVTHEPVDDNASGMQKTDIAHVIYQHVQEQVYLLYKLQDMQRIKITTGGGFKLLQRVLVDQGLNRLAIGQEGQIKVTLVPSDATTDGVNFQVSNPALVTGTSQVGNVFKFTGTGKGEVFIRVRVGAFEQNIPVEFSEEVPLPPVAVASVTVAPTSKSLVIGATQQLVPTVLPANATNKAVTYTSATPATATVSASGLITAVAVGTVNITVHTTDGNKTAVCAVTVTAS